ncbi:MAG: response regulator [Polyangiaceae bacterium]
MTRVLIVEDDPAQARSLARAFAKLRPDLSLLTSSNGVEAIKLMNERAVDLLLTDLQMPEMDGFELVAWTVSHCPDVAVFTMSAYGAEDTAARIHGLGGIEYFSKPIDPQAVLARLTDALNQSVRGHVQNLSLASFLQIMEMERKTCNLTIQCDDKSGSMVIRKGELVDARSADLRGVEAAISIIGWPNPSIMISRHNEFGPPVIQKSLGYIVMEAMRVQDEAAHNAVPLADGGSAWPAQRRSWRPHGVSSIPPSSPASAKPESRADLGLPSGATAVAIVETATGTILRSAAKEGCPLPELARMAALVLRHQASTLDLWNASEGVEELVLSTTTHCDLIRPLNGAGSRFALLVFEPEETNLVMARLELDRFVAGHR